LADLSHRGVLAQLIIVKFRQPVQTCYLLSLINMTVNYSKLGLPLVMLVFLSQPVHYKCTSLCCWYIHNLTAALTSRHDVAQNSAAVYRSSVGTQADSQQLTYQPTVGQQTPTQLKRCYCRARENETVRPSGNHVYHPHTVQLVLLKTWLLLRLTECWCGQ
jgi:hypothetical protein